MQEIKDTAPSAQNPKMETLAHEEYELLIHEDIAADKNTTVENKIKQVFYWIGFRVAAS